MLDVSLQVWLLVMQIRSIAVELRGPSHTVSPGLVHKISYPSHHSKLPLSQSVYGAKRTHPGSNGINNMAPSFITSARICDYDLQFWIFVEDLL